MSETPARRGPGAFVQTPQTNRRGPASPSSNRKSLQDISALGQPIEAPIEPLIPRTIIDDASQRLWVVILYGALWSWRIWDFVRLYEDDTESLWLFMKWISIDGVFLFGLPALRIPWLEWSSTVMTVLFMMHATVDAMLMFKIGLPITSWFLGLIKLVYDKELAISERRVKPGDIINNASLILGKQVVHILPEGSAMLNPNKLPFCLDSTIREIQLPILVNQTKPISIELLRVDLETNQNETISFGASQAKKLTKHAVPVEENGQTGTARMLHIPIKKPGYYRLQKMVDETKLEMSLRRAEAFVVPCPQAKVKSPGNHRCINELSNVALEVEGTPPLKIQYSTTVNGVERKASFQSIQPDDFISPFQHKSQPSGPLVLAGALDVVWARGQRVQIPMNESLTKPGKWIYSIEEVSDAFGNVVSYAKHEDDHEKLRKRSLDLDRTFLVHERPMIVMDKCDPQRPLRVAKGEAANLPVRFQSTGKQQHPISDAIHTIHYDYVAKTDLKADGTEEVVADKSVTLKTNQAISIKDSGLYTLKSVATEFCDGEVLEPSSCLLLNPPEPDLSISTEEISDKCAGNPIGLRVSLDLIGTPPFDIVYVMQKRGEKRIRSLDAKVSGLRGQVELTPTEAGHYTYTFSQIGDKFYKAHKLDKELVLEQDVKPAASAHFVERDPRLQACIDDTVSFDIRLVGEGPWSLEYELIHGGKREKFELKDIDQDQIKITTPQLKNGGEHTFSLVSITDKMKCKEFLKEHAVFNVRHQKPKASFGQLEGKRILSILDGKKVQVPLRLTGEAPWTIQYRNLDDAKQTVYSKTVRLPNDRLDVGSGGTYELLDVHDAVCPGSVDELANRFVVNTIGRPSMALSTSSTVKEETSAGLTKEDVCEGEDDFLDITLNGSPPYKIKYEVRHKPDHGSKSLREKDIRAPLGVASIKLETAQAGLYTYKFTELSDNNYDHDHKRHKALTVNQRVNSRPTARFTKPGTTYSYCTVDKNGDEVIPVSLTGIPPFELDIEIRHHKMARPEIFSVKNIPSTSSEIRIPRSVIHTGQSSLSIRNVRDSRGCQRKIDVPAASRVQVAVYESPTIAPLETHEHFCVGDHLSFTLGGVAPFNVFYEFNGQQRKASASGTTFRRIAEKPGTFTITGVSDTASSCRANVELTKHIHQLPTVRVSQGRESHVDIPEGGAAEILFEFSGAPPFEFTFTRSENTKRGKRAQILETRTERTEEHAVRIRASEEGTYEVVAVRDRWCAVSRQGADGVGKPQKLLTN